MKKPKHFIPKDRSVDDDDIEEFVESTPKTFRTKLHTSVVDSPKPDFKLREYHEKVQPHRDISEKVRKLKIAYASPISTFDERDVDNYASFDLYKTYTYSSVNIEASSDGSVKIRKMTDESS